MNDEKIIGPFTFLQFIYLAFGLGIIFFVNKNFSQNITIVTGIIVGFITFFAIKQSEPPAFNEEYIRTKKGELGTEEFKKWINRKIAIISSQIAIREARGLQADPMFSSALELLAKFKEE